MTIRIIEGDCRDVLKTLPEASVHCCVTSPLHAGSVKRLPVLEQRLHGVRLSGCPVGGMVLDPFGGAGTTGLVADRLQRSAILIELNAEYAAIARRRVSGDSPLFSEVAP